MLSEESKWIMQRFIEAVQQIGRMDAAQDLGPVKLLDNILDANTSVLPHIDRELIANREEAEKYLGALLGMM